MNTGGKQNLVSVDVADPGHYALVKQGRLDRASGPRQELPEGPGVDSQGIRAEPGPTHRDQIIERRVAPQPAESPRVAKDEPPPFAEVPDTMHVVVTMKPFAGWAVPQLPGHPQVHTDGRTAARDDRQLLAVTLQPFDALAHQEAAAADMQFRAARPREAASDDIRSSQPDPANYRAQ